MLETGEVFSGNIIGNVNHFTGEMVFFTNMTGHGEILSDPANSGKIVTFSYPLIGNCPVHIIDNKLAEDITGVVMGQLNEKVSGNSGTSLFHLLENAPFPTLINIDTRALVKAIQKYGTVYGTITDEINETEDINYFSQRHEACFISKASTKEVITYDNEGPHIVVIDYGSKKSIVHSLLRRNCKVTVVPYDVTFKQIEALKPDGVVLSNGPGDPFKLNHLLQEIKQVTETFPTLGISLGHELIALAYGVKSKKLKWGHHGVNYPVKELATGKVYMTYQNHRYTLVPESIKNSPFYPSYINVNDKSIEGIKHKFLPIQSVQFLPEATIGPNDTNDIYNEFLHTVQLAGGKIYAKG